MKLTVLGLSLSSSWGNGHATTFRALIKALSARGHDVMFLERDRPWYAANRDLLKPDFCGLALYDELADLDSWRVRIAASDATIIGSYVPDGIAVTTKIRPWTRLLAFYDIDTPVTMAALRKGQCAYLTPSLMPDYDLYLSFTGGPVLRMIEQHYGVPCARALYCAADPAIYRPADKPRGTPRWDLGYLGTYSADRQAALETLLLEPARLAPDRRFVVAGPQYPSDIAWPANVERIDHLSPAEHAAFYGDLGWTLNVTRADMIEAGYSPSVRLFEAAACATPIISDIWAGIQDVLQPGEEIVLAGSSEEVLSHLRKPYEERAAIGTAARARFLLAHTSAHRATQLEAYLLEAQHGMQRLGGSSNSAHRSAQGAIAMAEGINLQGRPGWDVPSPSDPPSIMGPCVS